MGSHDLTSATRDVYPDPVYNIRVDAWWDDPGALAAHHAAVLACRRQAYEAAAAAAREPMLDDRRAQEISERLAARRKSLGSSYAQLPEHQEVMS